MDKILIVEDDTLLNSTLAYHLQGQGFHTDSAFLCREAREKLAAGTFTLIILDVNLPDGDGFALCREIRKEWKVPVIFLTANDLESDILKGYDLGAADYVTKPFSIQVFLKKAERLLQMLSAGKEKEEDGYEDEDLRIGLQSMTSYLGGKEISFTPLEYRLLNIFIHNPGIVLTRQKLLERLWDDQGNYVDEHTLTTVISRMRSKLDGGHPYIKTVYGMGYLWNVKNDRRDVR